MNSPPRILNGRRTKANKTLNATPRITNGTTASSSRASRASIAFRLSHLFTQEAGGGSGAGGGPAGARGRDRIAPADPRGRAGPYLPVNAALRAVVPQCISSSPLSFSPFRAIVNSSTLASSLPG